MLDKKRAKEILLVALSQGGDFAEIFLESSTITAIELDNNKIEKLITGTNQGVGIRVVDGEKTFFENGNCTDPKTLMEIAKRLAEGIGKRRLINDIEFKKRNLKSFSQIKIHPGTVNITQKIELLNRANKAAWEYDPRVIQVTCIYQDKVQNVLVANSEGVFEKDQRVYPGLIVKTVAKAEDLIQSGLERLYGTNGFELFQEYSPEELARESARSAIFQLEAEPAPAGTYPVVILSTAQGGVFIHEAVGHGLEADLVEKGCSVFANKLGQKVASELITVVDDRTLPNKRGTAKIDDEGCPCQKVVLIHKGILIGYLQDRKFARKMGVPQTGHGRRESFRYLPIPRMGNTLIMPGQTPSQEIIESLKEGILITKMSGAGQVDTVSGNFVFNIAEAYLIKDGKKIPIRGATLIGNGPKILKEIDLVGNDLGFGVGGTCGKGQLVPVGDGQPTIRIPQIVIGGLLAKEGVEND